MKYVLEKSFAFEAMHLLVGHDGKCARPHGHSYKLTVVVSLDRVHADGPKKNMAMDFGDISVKVKPMIETYFDHRNLNETLGTDNPTAEYIAEWIFTFLSQSIAGLEAITINETATSSVTVRRS
uniref:6-pyruvoyl tetrahydrobiopterin synthase n=1 Tax=Rhodosorus marinus TaxID=101924 RepID=A0A7S3A9I6_9RHOD|mmetsp:Transcript_5227/g.22288  ORF Transcript_5227/g.22288 Transcript_5227/m.22288 type:complete len:124 (+) Transcript_5227:369-740(+)